MRSHGDRHAMAHGHQHAADIRRGMHDAQCRAIGRHLAGVAPGEFIRACHRIGLVVDDFHALTSPAALRWRWRRSITPLIRQPSRMASVVVRGTTPRCVRVFRRPAANAGLCSSFATAWPASVGGRSAKRFIGPRHAFEQGMDLAAEAHAAGRARRRACSSTSRRWATSCPRRGMAGTRRHLHARGFSGCHGRDVCRPAGSAGSETREHGLRALRIQPSAPTSWRARPCRDPAFSAACPAARRVRVSRG